MNLPRPLLPLSALLAALALGLAACGGGGGSATTDATEASTEEAKPALSKEELLKQGDALCAEVNTAVGSINGSAAEPSSQATQTANLYVNLVANIERLGAPSDAASEYAEFVAVAEELAKVEGEVKASAEREDIAALEEAEASASTAREAFQTQAGAFGFQQCSQGPSAVTTTPSSGAGAGGEEESGELEEGGIEVAPEGEVEEYVPEEEAPAIEEVEPEGGGAGVEEAAPEGGGEEESSSGGVGPG